MRRRDLMYRRGADVRTCLLARPSERQENLTCDRLLTNDWRSQCYISSILVIGSESRESKQMTCRRLVQPVYISGLCVNVTYADKHASNFPVQKYFYGGLQMSVRKEREYFCDMYSLIMYLCCRLKVQKAHYFAAELSSRHFFIPGAARTYSYVQ